MRCGGHLAPRKTGFSSATRQCVCVCCGGRGVQWGTRVSENGWGMPPHFYCLRQWGWLEGQKDIAHRQMLKRSAITVPLDLD